MKRLNCGGTQPLAVNKVFIISMSSFIDRVDSHDGSNDFESLFDCTVCQKFMVSPILQCKKGHLICSGCHSQYDRCPTCNCILGSIRNVSFEKVATKILFRCKYSLSGCSTSLSSCEKVEHENECEYRPFPCPSVDNSCEWQGDLKRVLNHLSTAHSTIKVLQGEAVSFLAMNINIPGKAYWVIMQSCFDQNFMMVLGKQSCHDEQNHYFAYAQLIGPQNLCKNFTYCLKFKKRKKSLIWRSIPCSMYNNLSKIYVNSECLKFDERTAQRFTINNILEIHISISIR